MTQAQHKAQLRRIIKVWRSRLMIEHIAIDVDWDEEPDNPHAMAAVSPSEYYDQATMWFANGWEELTIDVLNVAVVHELLHIMFRDYASAVRSIDVTGAISTDLRALWHDRCHDAEEGLIDRLATRLVELGGVVE